jgi:hypothetical protein
MLGSPDKLTVLFAKCGSDNLSDRDNQQERLQNWKGVSMTLDVKKIPPEIGFYLAGFVDGEGSFNISFRPRNDYRNPWKISACFNVSQKERPILALLKRYLECGTMRERPDGVVYYEVNNINALIENVIPFFSKFQFLSQKKKRDFSKFCQIVEMLSHGQQNDLERVKEILELRQNMNDGGKRKYSEQEILEKF